MTREETIEILKAFMENPLFNDAHKAAFNIAIHDIKQRHDWDINNLILINKDNYEPTAKNNLEVDCISRADAIRVASGYCHPSNVAKELAKLPSVTPQETRKGHWIDTDEWRETVDEFEQWGYFRKCSKCGYVFKFLEIDNYCPNCGADMREVEE